VFSKNRVFLAFPKLN